MRLYIRSADEPRLKKLCETTGLNGTDALTKIVSAGLTAMENNGYRMMLPLKFEVVEDGYVLREAPTKGKR